MSSPEVEGAKVTPGKNFFAGLYLNRFLNSRLNRALEAGIASCCLNARQLAEKSYDAASTDKAIVRIFDRRKSALKKEDLMNTVSAENGRATAGQFPKFESDLMTRKEAAAYLGVSEITLAIWCSTRRYNLRVYKVGRLAKYKKSDLDAFIASGVRA